MAKINIKGLEQYSAKLNRLSALLKDEIIGAAVYDGAGLAADCVRSALAAVPSDEGHYKDKKKLGPSEADKEAVLNAIGITPLQNDNGFLNRKVGFGYKYYGPPTKRYPRGRPVQMVARSIRSGTSWMQANDFIKTAVRKSRKAAEAAMAERIEKEIERIMN